MGRETYTIKQIADALSAECFGDTDIRIVGAAEPQSAAANQLAIATDKAYAEKLAAGQARAALLWQGADWRALGLDAAIVPRRPRYAMSSLTKLLDPGQGIHPGIHDTASIDPTGELGENVSIGPLAVISAGARIGSGSVIGAQCFVGWNARIGQNCFLRDHVSIGARVTIGDRVICQPGARIGSDGFSYVTPDRSAVEAARSRLGDRQDIGPQSWVRIHSLGAVTLGDDVEVGANTTIDNGTIRDTRVGDRTKIDNLVQIGHNCSIGTDCLLCGLVGLAGSVHVGNHVVLGGQVGVTDNISIGDGVIAGGGSTILSNVPAGRTTLGYPAIKMDSQIDIYKSLRRLPKLMRDFAAVKKAVFKSKPNE
jgi:UDP-3-O-[3-hydroxymyristoyl] glucosamine N-acyltransferase